MSGSRVPRVYACLLLLHQLGQPDLEVAPDNRVDFGPQILLHVCLLVIKGRRDPAKSTQNLRSEMALVGLFEKLLGLIAAATVFNFTNFWWQYCVVRNMLQFGCDQDVPAQRTAEVL